MAERKTLTKEKKREGIVVWDQHGLVVVWPEGHSSRFSWETLQHISCCTECHTHSPQPPTTSYHALQLG